MSITRSLSIILPALAFTAALGASASEARACGYITVTNTGDFPDLAPGDGTCATQWGFCSLRAAVMEANACAGADTIIVPAGTGTITLANSATEGDLHITDDVIMAGNGVVIDASNAGRIFHVFTGASVDISGVSLVNGWGGTVGGAIYNQGDLTLSDCTLSGNAAIDQGGAIKNITPGSLVISGCELHDNEADWGGAIYSNGALEISDSSIHQNEAFLFAGGVSISGTAGTAAIIDTYIGANIAGERGGGVAAFSPVDLVGSTIEFNVAGTMGGGLYMYSSSAVVDAFKTDFGSNFADEGGAIFNFWGDLSLRRANVFANHATTTGGGIDNQGALFAVRGTIHDNTAAAGAGIYNYWTHADLTLKNMTISGNDATGLGGGLYVHGSSIAALNNVTLTNNTGLSGGLQGFGATTMSNTILGGNLDLGGAPSDCVGSVTSDGYNLVQDTAGCTISGPATADVYGTAPGLDPLANNGGRTPTHAVQAGSAARNAGDDATCQPVDQRGVGRPLGGACDMGAFEGS